jgi:hypothetical protein
LISSSILTLETIEVTEDPEKSQLELSNGSVLVLPLQTTAPSEGRHDPIKPMNMRETVFMTKVVKRD